MVRTKGIINVTLKIDLINWLDANVSKNHRSGFIENTLLEKINKNVNPLQALKYKIEHHEKIVKENRQLADDARKLLAMKKGDLTPVDTNALRELNERSDRLKKIDEFNGHAVTENSKFFSPADASINPTKEVEKIMLESEHKGQESEEKEKLLIRSFSSLKKIMTRKGGT